MSKITRKTAQIFGINSGFHEMGQFGSLAAGSPAYSTDPAVIQALSNWLDGWYAAVVGGNSPAIQDMNAVHYVLAYQTAYLMEQGIAEWDSGTTYYTGSLCAINLWTFTCSSANATAGAIYTDGINNYTVLKTISAGTVLVCSGGQTPGSSPLTKVSGTGDASITFSNVTYNGVGIFASKVDNQTNQTILTTSQWSKVGGNQVIQTVTSAYTVLPSDDVILASGTTTITLPAASGVVGRVYTVKNIDASASTVTVATASGNIDGASTYSLPEKYQFVRMISDGVNYQIIGW